MSDSLGSLEVRSFQPQRPRPLELTAADELVAMENIEILRQNGFEIDVNEDPDLSSGQGHRLKLVAQPISKSTVFDMKGAFARVAKDKD